LELIIQMHARQDCAKGQGYLLAKPMALAQLPAAIGAAARFVRNHNPSIAENVGVTVAALPAATGDSLTSDIRAGILSRMSCRDAKRLRIAGASDDLAQAPFRTCP
jgi:hypothetical protein